jgi:RHS repeat-associated protein
MVRPRAGSEERVLAQYEYGPFGELLRATGPMAKANPFRFSTKYQDDETDLVYYGRRYLNTSTGRWLSRVRNRDESLSSPYR